MTALQAEPTIEECRESIARTVEHIRTAGRTWADFLLLHATKGFDDPSQAEVMLADLFDKHIDASLPPAFNDRLRAECLAAFRERFAFIAPHAALRASA